MTFLQNLFKPKSQDYYLAQKEYVLNVILIGLVVLFVFLTLISVSYKIYLGELYTGESPWLVLSPGAVFGLIYWIARKGWVKFSSCLVFLVFLIFANVVSVTSGMENPTSLLLFVWVIVLTGILFDRNTALFLNIFSAINIFFISWLQINKYLSPNLDWKHEEFNYFFGISYVLILVIIALISSLYNREITNSLRRALSSEKELQEERDLLEIRVEERTRDLKKSQMEEMERLSRFAQFGKSMSGLIHDIVNPVTAISLNLNQLCHDVDKEKIDDVKDCTANALSAATKIERLIFSTRKKLQNIKVCQKIPVEKQIAGELDLFKFKIKKAGIEIKTDIVADIFLYGDTAKFDQIISNLISNAIEALENCDKKYKEITISAKIHQQNVLIEFFDNADGILKKNINLVFQPFYSTKTDKNGTGIGLFITREIVEKDFDGTISIESIKKIGTKFEIILPIKRNG